MFTRKQFYGKIFDHKQLTTKRFTAKQRLLTQCVREVTI